MKGTNAVHYWGFLKQDVSATRESVAAIKKHMKPITKTQMKTKQSEKTDISSLESMPRWWRDFFFSRTRASHQPDQVSKRHHPSSAVEVFQRFSSLPANTLQPPLEVTVGRRAVSTLPYGPSIRRRRERTRCPVCVRGMRCRLLRMLPFRRLPRRE